MAKMNGFQLKKLTRLEGDNGHEFFMADVYLQNKKIFKWAQNYYANNPCFIIPYKDNIDMSRLWEAVSEKNAKLKNVDNFSELQALWKNKYCKESVDKYFNRLALLTEWEKVYRRERRKYDKIILGFVTNGNEIYAYSGTKTVQELRLFMENKEYGFKKDDITDYYFFEKLDDFNFFEDIDYNSIFSDIEKKQTRRVKNKSNNDRFR